MDFDFLGDEDAYDCGFVDLCGESLSVGVVFAFVEFRLFVEGYGEVSSGFAQAAVGWDQVYRDSES